MKENKFKYYLAEAISWVLNPAILALSIICISVWKSPMDFTVKIIWLLIAIVMNAIIPLLFYINFLKKGYVFDGPVTEKTIHRNRIRIFAVIIFLVALQIIAMILTHIYQPLLMVLMGGLLAVGLVLIITYFWKISLHSGMTTIFVAMFLALYGIDRMWPMIILIPLVFWSRLFLGRHSFLQLTGGVVLSCLVVFLTLYIFRIVL